MGLPRKKVKRSRNRLYRLRGSMTAPALEAERRRVSRRFTASASEPARVLSLFEGAGLASGGPDHTQGRNERGYGNSKSPTYCDPAACFSGPRFFGSAKLVPVRFPITAISTISDPVPMAEPSSNGIKLRHLRAGVGESKGPRLPTGTQPGRGQKMCSRRSKDVNYARPMGSDQVSCDRIEISRDGSPLPPGAFRTSSQDPDLTMEPCRPRWKRLSTCSDLC